MATSLLNLIQAAISFPGSQEFASGLRPKVLLLCLGGPENQASIPDWDKDFSILYGVLTKSGFHKETYPVYTGC